MKQSRFGLILLLSSGAALACNGDPTSSIRESSPARIITTPSVIFLNQGATTFLTVQLVDAQGSQLATVFDATSAGPQATLARDTTFLATTNGANLNTTDRFTVTAGELGPTTITVTAGGATVEVPMGSLPTAVGATFSATTLAQNQPVTITAPDGYTFTDTANVVFGVNNGTVFSRSDDGKSILFLPPPGSSGKATVAGVVSDLFPTASLSLPTLDSIKVDTLAPLPGTDNAATAPALLTPPAGTLTVSFDKPDFVATIDHFYNFDVTEAGDYTITVDWTAGSDIDAAIDGDFGGGTASANKPESGTFTLAAGTHQLLVEDFGGDAAGTTLTITIEH